MKKLLLHKVKGGTTNLMMGTMVIFTLCSIMILETMLHVNITAANYIEDNMTSSILGCMLADPDEYGASNTFVIYDLLENHAYDGKSYIDHVEGLLLNQTDPFKMYHNTYLFNSVNEINTIGSLTAYNISGDYGPKQCFEDYISLLKTNMNLDNNLVPRTASFLPKTVGSDSTEPNKVSIDCFKVYNCIEFMVKGANYDTDIRKPVVDLSGNTVYMNNSSGTPLYKTSKELKDAGLIHTKVIEFNITPDNVGGVALITATEHALDSKVYITNEFGDQVIGQDGNKILVDASGVYTKLSCCIKLGDKLTGDDISYRKVAHERTAFIESSR